ncbi:hypothetical protein, partial [Adhaeribacter terreus]
SRFIISSFSLPDDLFSISILFPFFVQIGSAKMQAFFLSSKFYFKIFEVVFHIRISTIHFSGLNSYLADL